MPQNLMSERSRDGEVPSSKDGWCSPMDFLIYNPTLLLLEATLRSNKRVMSLLHDDDFAQMLADILAHSTGEFCTLDGQILLHCGSDDARAIVAHLRDRGENYLHFKLGLSTYPLNIEKKVVLEVLQEAGWRRPTDEEFDLLRAVAQHSDRPR